MNGTVHLRVVGEPPRPPRQQRNIDRRPREYLTPAEVETLMATARKRSRYGHRDATMILIAYRRAAGTAPPQARAGALSACLDD